jgi:hypothetical protein
LGVEDSAAKIEQNTFAAYGSAINATGLELTVMENSIRQFLELWLSIKDSSKPPYFYSNIAFSNNEKVKVLNILGKEGGVTENEMVKED